MLKTDTVSGHMYTLYSLPKAEGCMLSVVFQPSGHYKANFYEFYLIISSKVHICRRRRLVQSRVEELVAQTQDHDDGVTSFEDTNLAFNF